MDSCIAYTFFERFRYSYTGSNYGHHHLRLENLNRTDAGRYVCRSSADPQSFKPASSFVVVVADRPICRSNEVVDGTVTASCIVVYNGMLNVTLSLVRLDDNRVIVTRNYTSMVSGSWWRLTAEVRVSDLDRRRPSALACRAEFRNTKALADIARNRPASIEAVCKPENGRLGVGTTAPNRDGDGVRRGNIKVKDATTGTPTDGLSTPSLVAIGLLAAALFVAIPALVVFLIVRRRRKISRKQRRHRCDDDSSWQISGEENGVNATAETSTSFLPAEAAKKSPKASINCSAKVLTAHYQVSASNDPPSPVIGEASHAQPSSDVSEESFSLRSDTHSVDNTSAEATSGSEDEEQEDEEDSNEITVMPSTGRELAQAAAASHYDGSTDFRSTHPARQSRNSE